MSITVKSILAKRKLLISVLLIVVGVILVLFVANRGDKPTHAATRPLDVEVVQVVQEDVPVYSEWIGTTDGLINADIKAQVTGYLLKQDYKECSRSCW